MSIPSPLESVSTGYPIVSGSRLDSRGFTLLELMVVLAIVALLLTIAAPRYFIHLDRAKEAGLKQTLFITRDALDKFHADKGRLPNSLDELVAERYLRKRPLDPITERADTWLISTQEGGGIHDLHSGAEGIASDGTRYGEW